MEKYKKSGRAGGERVYEKWMSILNMDEEVV